MAKKSLQDINPLEYDLSTNVSVSPKQQTDRLIQLGKGVYKDKISGKLLYNYDEMPTAEVVGHKKEKSIFYFFVGNKFFPSHGIITKATMVRRFLYYYVINEMYGYN